MFKRRKNKHLYLDSIQCLQKMALDEWIDNLPWTNMGETTRIFNAFLAEFNKATLSIQHRIEAMEIIAHPGGEIIDHLTRQLVARSLPLHPKSQLIFQLSLHLLNQLLFSYKVIVRDLGRNKNTGNGSQLLQAILSAIMISEQIFLLCGRLHTPASPNFWHDLHTLHEYKSHYSPIFTQNTEKPLSANIDSIYFRINILAIADPITMKLGELNKLDSYLKLNPCTIPITRSVPDKNQNRFIFIIGKNRNTLPQPLVKTNQVNVTEKCCYLTLDDCLNEFSKKDDIEARLLRIKIMKNAIRADDRISKTSTADLEIGFKKIIESLKREDQNNTPDKQENSLKEPLFSFDPNWEIVPHENQWLNRSERLAVNLTAPSSLDTKKNSNDIAKDSTWRIKNISPGGACLLWQHEIPTKIQIGELISYIILGSRKKLATIKWMQYLPGQGLYIGIQNISTQFILASIRRDPHVLLKKPEITDGLIVYNLNDTSTINSIIVQERLDLQGKKIQVTAKNRTFEMLLAKRIHFSTMYQQYRCIVDTHPTSSANQDSVPNKSEHNFDSLWEKL